MNGIYCINVKKSRSFFCGHQNDIVTLEKIHPMVNAVRKLSSQLRKYLVKLQTMALPSIKYTNSVVHKIDEVYFIEGNAIVCSFTRYFLNWLARRLSDSSQNGVKLFIK